MSYYIIIRGPLGCGKSTISKRLSEKIKAKYLSVDTILDDYGLTNEWEEGYISQNSFIKANGIIADRARIELAQGKHVLFDGNFYWKSQIDDLIKRLNGYQGFVFTLKAPLDICIERDKKRKKKHGEDATKAVYKKSTEFSIGKIIEVTKPINKIIKEIISYLPKNDKS